MDYHLLCVWLLCFLNMFAGFVLLPGMVMMQHAQFKIPVGLFPLRKDTVARLVIIP